MCPGNTVPLSLVEKMAKLNSKEDGDVQKARDVRAGQGCSESCRSFRVKNLGEVHPGKPLREQTRPGE